MLWVKVNTISSLTPASQAADKRMAEQYGVDLDQYGNTERPGASYTGKKDWDQLSDDVAAAAANDYDLRRSIEAAQASGNKKAQAIGNISNASEAYAATRFMEKTHKNRMENGGAYDGANDQGNVTNYWTNKQKDKEADDFKTMYMNDINSLRKKLEITQRVKEPSETDPQSFEHSDAVASAKERLDDYNLSIGELDLFNPMNESPPRANDQKDAAISFADQYKMDVSDASDLGEVTARNLNNAAATVAYGR